MDEKEELERLRAENAELKAMLEEATSPGAPGIAPAETVFTAEEIKAMPRETVRSRLDEILRSLKRR
ncbi:MAG: hypothetical protein K6D94_10410 [Clostridiales bacterium]|nr:hypothetical protein [Clostridiales bacterium]